MTIKKWILMILAALLCISTVACVEQEQPTSVLAIAESVQQEAYIDKSEFKLPQVQESIRPETIKVEAYTGRGATAAAESTAAPESESESVTLVPVTVCGETLYRMNDTNFLTMYPSVYSPDAMLAITKCAERIKGLEERHPNLKIYTYFITRSTDCNWFNETEGIDVFDLASFFESQLEGTNVKSDRFHIADFQDYMDTGYKTDFHINYIGSDRVYGDVYDMMSKDMDMGQRVQPVEVLEFDDLLIAGDYYNINTEYDREAMYAEVAALTEDELDIFKAYRYVLPDFKTYINDNRIILGLEEEYMAGQIQRVRNAGHQFIYYGGQTDIVRFEFDQPDKPNLLMCSDSQGRPSRNEIASHFNRTIYMNQDQWRDSDLDKIIEENNITVMLLIGQHSIFELYG